MFALQWFSMRAMTEPNPQAKMMMYFMPVFMTILFLNFASGLNLYYTAMNFASVPQQLQITRERQRYQAQRAQGHCLFREGSAGQIPPAGADSEGIT